MFLPKAVQNLNVSVMLPSKNRGLQKWSKSKTLVHQNIPISQSSSESIKVQQMWKLTAIQNVEVKGAAVREKQPGDGKQVILNFSYK